MTHVSQNVGYTIFKNGHVADCVWKARERGIIFEAADAERFSLGVSEKAIAEKFYPDLLPGTDVTRLSMHYVKRHLWQCRYPKYTYLGMPFEKVIKAATWNNAENMGISDRVGSLRKENRLILQCSEYMKVKMYSATDRIQMRQLHLEKAMGCSKTSTYC